MVKVLYELTRETKEGDTIQVKIFNVNKDSKYPNGVKYRLALIHKERRVLGFDNTYPEKDHKHTIKGNKEVKVRYGFIDIETLLNDFRQDVNKWRFDKYGSNHKR